MELVSDPAILLLDEPTSGLDSYNARQLLATLRSVAAGGRVVVSSLHQPSPAMYSMLDQVCGGGGGRRGGGEVSGVAQVGV